MALTRLSVYEHRRHCVRQHEAERQLFNVQEMALFDALYDRYSVFLALCIGLLRWCLIDSVVNDSMRVVVSKLHDIGRGSLITLLENSCVKPCNTMTEAVAFRAMLLRIHQGGLCWYPAGPSYWRWSFLWHLIWAWKSFGAMIQIQENKGLSELMQRKIGQGSFINLNVHCRKIPPDVFEAQVFSNCCNDLSFTFRMHTRMGFCARPTWSPEVHPTAATWSPCTPWCKGLRARSKREPTRVEFVIFPIFLFSLFGRDDMTHGH